MENMLHLFHSHMVIRSIDKVAVFQSSSVSLMELDRLNKGKNL
jgi:hypothetical protein